MKERFDGKAPFIKYSRGDNHGLVGFHKTLSEEDITYIEEAIKTINGNEVTWTLPNGTPSLPLFSPFSDLRGIQRRTKNSSKLNVLNPGLN